MNSDEFEKRLRTQPLRRVPQTWRASILAAAAAELNPAPAVPLMPPSHRWFNPSAAAWGALAAIWLLMVGINTLLIDRPPMASQASVADRSDETSMLGYWRREDVRMLVQLINETPGEPTKVPINDRPRPRSDATREDRFGVLEPACTTTLA